MPLLFLEVELTCQYPFEHISLAKLVYVHLYCAKKAVIKLAAGLNVGYFVHYECAKRK